MHELNCMKCGNVTFNITNNDMLTIEKIIAKLDEICEAGTLNGAYVVADGYRTEIKSMLSLQ